MTAAVNDNGVLALGHGYALAVSDVHDTYSALVGKHIASGDPERTQQENNAQRTGQERAQLPFASLYHKKCGEKQICQHEPRRHIRIFNVYSDKIKLRSIFYHESYVSHKIGQYRRRSRAQRRRNDADEADSISSHEQNRYRPQAQDVHNGR